MNEEIVLTLTNGMFFPLKANFSMENRSPHKECSKLYAKKLHYYSDYRFDILLKVPVNYKKNFTLISTIIVSRKLYNKW